MYSAEIGARGSELGKAGFGSGDPAGKGVARGFREGRAREGEVRVEHGGGGGGGEAGAGGVVEEVEERGGGDGGEHNGDAVEESPDISIHFEFCERRGEARRGAVRG